MSDTQSGESASEAVRIARAYEHEKDTRLGILSREVLTLHEALQRIANQRVGVAGRPLDAGDHKNAWWAMRETARAALDVDNGGSDG